MALSQKFLPFLSQYISSYVHGQNLTTIKRRQFSFSFFFKKKDFQSLCTGAAILPPPPQNRILVWGNFWTVCLGLGFAGGAPSPITNKFHFSQSMQLPVVITGF